jgi:hypothetical protein
MDLFLFYYSQNICAQFGLSKNDRMSCFQKPNYIKFSAKNLVKNDQEVQL